ncbi:EcsC family protein [Mycolicibacterium baixiangningiae]|uniref:EcsC family protein n=1 Tax=Mycolicibacterium baixiangningiae TaxID=2761578 RepID=UPI001D00CB3A|nr:EcsC family protein [Mycolicibacterium baixiangningiae]
MTQHSLTEVVVDPRPHKRIGYPIVKVAERFAGQFGQKLTKKKLGQFVPIAGIAIGAALNWKMVDDVADAAYWAYRERFLYENGGELPLIVLDAEVDNIAHEDAGEAPIDVLGIRESEGIDIHSGEPE